MCKKNINGMLEALAEGIAKHNKNKPAYIFQIVESGLYIGVLHNQIRSKSKALRLTNPKAATVFSEKKGTRIIAVPYKTRK